MMNSIEKPAKSDPKITIRDHTESVCRISLRLSELAGTPPDIRSYAFIAALFHDLGKASDDFQMHLSDDGYDTEHPHGAVSFAIMMRHVRPAGMDAVKWKAAMKAVLLHHPIGASDCVADYDASPIMDAVEWAVAYNNEYNDVKLEIGDYAEDPDEVYSEFGTSDYATPFTDKPKSQVNENFLLISGNLRCADVFASMCERGEMSEDDVESHFNLGRVPRVDDFRMPEGYDPAIFGEQKKYAMSVSANGGICEINEPVGFGKTDAVIMAALTAGRKILFVSPTNITARNSYRSIVGFLDTYGMGGAFGVGLLLTNKWAEGAERGDSNDIIVTNIDNYVYPVFKSDRRKSMAYDISYRTVVFDEYHQYFGKSAVMQAFVLSVKSRSRNANATTILSSATRQESLLTGVGGRITRFPKTRLGCGRRRIRIHYSGFSDAELKDDCCIVTNSVSECQRKAASFASSHPGSPFVVYHSRFTDGDRKSIEDTVLSSYGKGSANHASARPKVFATNIISTGVNVSFGTMVIYGLPLYEMYQSIGRCNRFGEYDCGDVYIDTDSPKSVRSEIKAIESKWDSESYFNEMRLLKEALPEGEYSVSEIDEAFDSIIGKIDYSALKRGFQNKSAESLSKISYRYAGGRSDSGDRRISSNPSLRSGNQGGESEEVFVWCEGMVDGETLVYDIRTDDEWKYSKPMADYLDRHRDVRTRYFTDRRWKSPKCRGFRTFLAMAKCDATPFILTRDNFAYDSVYGLRIEKIQINGF